MLIGLGVCLLTLPLRSAPRQAVPADGEAPVSRPATPGYTWVRDLPGPIAADGATDAERLYLALESAELISLARADGRQVWSRPVAAAWPPLVAGDALLAAGHTGVHILDAATGDERRALTFESPPAGPLGAFSRGFIISLESGAIAAFDVNGRTLWTVDVGRVSRVEAASSPDGSMVYVALTDGRLAALSGADGAEIWTRDIGGTLRAPTVAEGRVYVGSTTRAVYAFDGRTGRLLWDVPTGGDVVGTTADDEALYAVSLDNVVRALHLARGSLKWKQVLPTRPMSVPVRSGTRLLMGGVRPQLLAFDARTGEPVTTLAMPNVLELAMLAGAPLVFPAVPDANPSVALVTRDGRIFGLTLDAVEKGL